MNEIVQAVQGWWWSAAILAGAVILAILGHWVLFFLAERVSRRSQSVIDNSVVRHARRPGRMIVALMAALMVLPAVRLAARHRSAFARKQAVRTLGALRDAVGVGVCVARLDDELPSIRRAALTALQDITGERSRTDPAVWRAWCAARDCRGKR